MFGKKERFGYEERQYQTASTPSSQYSNYHSNALHREVPFSCLLSCYVGGWFNQVVWGFVLFSSVIAWGFLPRVDLWPLKTYGKTLQSTQAQIVSLETTNVTIGDSKASGANEVWAYDFTFDYEGTLYSGRSYGMGRTLEEGAKPTVVFPADTPELAVIDGMRANMFSPWALGVVLLPLTALLLLVKSIRSSKRLVELLQNGELTYATIESSKATNVKVNNRPVYKFELSFQDNQQRQQQFTIHTSIVRIFEKDHVQVIYHRQLPETAAVVELLPGTISFDENQRLTAGFPPIVCLILPLLSIVGNVLAARSFLSL